MVSLSKKSIASAVESNKTPTVTQETAQIFDNNAANPTDTQNTVNIPESAEAVEKRERTESRLTCFDELNKSCNSLDKGLRQLSSSIVDDTYWKSSLEQLHFDQINNLLNHKGKTNETQTTANYKEKLANLNGKPDTSYLDDINASYQNYPVSGHIDINTGLTGKDSSIDLVEEVLKERQEIIDKALDSLSINIGKIQDVSKEFSDFLVPTKLVQMIDENINPQLFTQKVIENLSQVNLNSRNCQTRLIDFRAKILLECAKIFPEDTLKYKQINKL